MNVKNRKKMQIEVFSIMSKRLLSVKDAIKIMSHDVIFFSQNVYLFFIKECIRVGWIYVKTFQHFFLFSFYFWLVCFYFFRLFLEEKELGKNIVLELFIFIIVWKVNEIFYTFEYTFVFHPALLWWAIWIC